MPNLTTYIQRLLKKTDRMKRQAVRGLLRTLNQIERERKKRTADLEQSATIILKQLAELGHTSVNSKVATGAGKHRRTRRSFAVSGEQSILNFVKAKSNPVGKEIQKQWASEGRAGAAANLISKLVKEKRLKRVPLKGERGSRYSLV